MKRRPLIIMLAGAAAAWPLAARAQQSERMRRIGVLMGYPEGDVQARANVVALQAGLEGLGWVEGRNIRFDFVGLVPIRTRPKPSPRNSSR